MAIVLLLLLIAVPIIEISVFIQAGELIGLWPTLALVVLTAIAGSALLRYQGLVTLARARASLERDRLPLAELFDGLCLFAAGLLLLTPGFVTDGLGLLLFLPPVRLGLRLWLVKRIIDAGGFSINGRHIDPRGADTRPANRQGDVIDGDFEVVPPPDRDDRAAGPGDDGNPDSPWRRRR